jgi:hypothetical protein
MDKKEINKMKKELFGSVMKNPELSKKIKEAMSAPIGSTKRKQAKSILSIMKKMRGVSNDGMGGPIMGVPQQKVQNKKPNIENYDNIVIFPAAPSLKNKVKIPTPQKQNINNGQGGTYDGQGGILDNISNFFKSNSDQKTDPSNTYNVNQQIGSMNLTNNSNNSKLSNLGLTVKPIDPNIGTKSSISNTSSSKTNSVTPSSLTTPIDKSKVTNFNLNTDPNQSVSSFYKTPSVNDAYKNLGLVLNKESTQPNTKANNVLSGDEDINIPNVTPPWMETKKETVINNTQSKSDIALNNSINNEDHIPVVENKGTDVKKEDLNKNTLNYLLNNTNTNTNSDTKSKSFNIAASSIAKILNTTPDAKLSTIPIDDLGTAIATNEGYFNGTSKVAIRNNNPGNLKYVGQEGATKDSNGFAVFSTPQEGAQALINDLTAKYNSGKYSTINDLMSVYSPDYDNPANPNYTGSSNIYTKDTDGDTDLISDVNTAVNNNLGSVNFALGIMDKKYGGNLSEMIEDIDKATKEEFKLPELEQKLSELKAKKENFIPTLSMYIKGKDKYGKVIDKLIRQTEESLTTKDMNDPQTARRYTNYLNYLYEIKGRQSSRYGNYLNAAIGDYNSDVTELENEYKDAVANYTSVLNTKSNIAKEDYENTYNRLVNLYTEIQDAPIKARNLEILTQQIDSNNITNFKNLMDQYNGTDEDFLKKKNEYIDNIADKDGIIDMDKIPSGSLEYIYGQGMVKSGGKDLPIITESLRQVLSKTLNSNKTDQSQIFKIKEMINDLRTTEYSSQANDLNNALSSTIKSLTSDYVLGKLGDIQDATKELVKGNFWGRKPGLQDKDAWMERNSSLNTDFLNLLYNTINNSVQENPSILSDPNPFLEYFFLGDNDKDKADNISDIISITS